MPVGRIAGRDESHRGKRQRFVELARELEMSVVNRVECAAENPECANRPCRAVTRSPPLKAGTGLLQERDFLRGGSPTEN
jgi:hypothetical protein